MDFINKTILIISQQPMGEMFLSKHHYAIELGLNGSEVYFLHPPDQKCKFNRGEIKILPTQYQGLYQVDHRLWIPYNIKFHLRSMYDFYMKCHVREILKKINKRVDLIWSFDISDTIPLRCFPSNIRKIFMPVDQPYGDHSIRAAEGASHLISITREIIKAYEHTQIPALLLNHGVHPAFLQNELQPPILNEPVRVGLSGNFARPDLDRDSLLKIIASHQEIQFECWGNYAVNNSNLGEVSKDDQSFSHFIQKLVSFENVIMHGPVNFQDLASAIKNVDMFLICYDVKKDQSKGTNYHKVMEYLATGKMIVGNRISAFNDKDFVMSVDDETNELLPELFNVVVKNLRKYNAESLQVKRIEFAASNTYAQQLDKIASFIN